MNCPGPAEEGHTAVLVVPQTTVAGIACILKYLYFAAAAAV